MLFRCEHRLDESLYKLFTIIYLTCECSIEKMVQPAYIYYILKRFTINYINYCLNSFVMKHNMPIILLIN